MPRRQYVLLRHECPADYRDGPHWDLMIEDGESLRTWSLLELPAAWGGARESVAATPLPPHRKAYLDYEGQVSGGRGRVKRLARGECEFESDDSVLVVAVANTGHLRGVWRLRREATVWLLSVD